MTRRLLLLLTLAVAVTASGCAGSGYFADRGRDLRDVAILDLGIGYPLLEIDIRATDYLSFCIGAAESKRWRLLGKWTELDDVAEFPRHRIKQGWIAPSRNEANIGWPSAMLAGWANEEYPPTGTWISIPEFLDLETGIDPYVSNWLCVDDPGHAKPLTEKFDLAAGFTIPFLTARFGLSPGNFVDLLAGIVTLDPAGDDDR